MADCTVKLDAHVRYLVLFVRALRLLKPILSEKQLRLFVDWAIRHLLWFRIDGGKWRKLRIQ